MGRRYEITVIIEEGSDEFWEQLEGTGCDIVTQLVDDAVTAEFHQNVVEVTLESFWNTKN